MFYVFQCGVRAVLLSGVIIDSGRLERCYYVLRFTRFTCLRTVLPFYRFILNQLNVPLRGGGPE